MFYEQIAALTRDHHMTHVQAYLDEINAEHDKNVTLVSPKRYDTTTLLGGQAGVSRETLPAYTIHAYEKTLSQTNENLWTYVYQGRLTGMVQASDSESVERMAKRHAGAAERFLMDHEFPQSPVNHFNVPQPPSFLIAEIVVQRSSFFGAALVREDEQLQWWMDGFLIDFHWVVSENGPKQH